MLKRLIEVALPLREVSEQSAREKSIRHGHISTLHIWWARRPLAACRAVVFASLIPDPDDPDCPEHFKQLVRAELGDQMFKPKDIEGSTIEDTPRNRCLEFIKLLVRWENSNEPVFVEPARKLIAEAHKIFNTGAKDEEMPKVLDPFAGGGAIPLEALRLGCEAHAIDINPVAHLIQLCTLVYPQKYGKPLSPDKDIPNYIKMLIAHNKAKGKGKSSPSLFDKKVNAELIESDGLIPDVDISDSEYHNNPLSADIKYWGYWVLAHAKDELQKFYPLNEDGSIPVAYLWAKTVKCPNPACGSTIPLIKQLWLCRKKDRNVAIKIVPEEKTKKCKFEVLEDTKIDFDPNNGTMQRGDSTCPFCNSVATVEYLRIESCAGRLGQELMVVASVKEGESGKQYRSATEADLKSFRKTINYLKELKSEFGEDIVPNEIIIKNARGQISPPIWGLDEWGKLFNERQLSSIIIFILKVKAAMEAISVKLSPEYAKAIGSYLGLALSRFVDFNSSLCLFNNIGGRGVVHTFGRQALPMVWDYAETNPFNPQGANWLASVSAGIGTVEKCPLGIPAKVDRGSASNLALEDKKISAVFTDPPYYDAVPYSDLSDFFYVWQKRVLSDIYPENYRTPLTPKSQEIIQAAQRHGGDREKAAQAYENMMEQALTEIHRTLANNGIAAVMFAHKETAAWETTIGALMSSGLLVTSSWPIHTERPGRMVANNTAALASSVTLVCRKRAENAGEGFWDEVQQELRDVANERLDFFWNQGIRGADFFISAIGPALSVFGKYEKVKRLTGEEVTVGQFLDEVRSLVTGYALNKIIKSKQTTTIDCETRFYVVWKWSYGNTRVPADEAFKMAQALGLDTEMMWDRTGTLEKNGQNVNTISIAKRMKISNLGEPESDGSPASIIDTLHRMCGLRDKGENQSLADFLARSGHAKNETLWIVAQAVSEILPDGDKEKQLMQGLLNQRDNLQKLTEDAKLFD